MKASPAVLFALLSSARALAAACRTDLDCSLNGVCGADGACACDAPWKDSAGSQPGEHCSVLDVGTHPVDYIPAYGGNLNTAWDPRQPLTSWGGNMIFDERSGLYHLFVSAMSGGQGLQAWGSVSEIHHATAQHPMKPFKRKDLALPKEAHNASPIRAPNGTWLIFYIGEKVNHARRGRVSAADSPGGPWRSIPFDVPCNNPAPAYAPNGTLYCVCSNGTWTVFRSEDVFSGVWRPVTKLVFPPSWGGGVGLGGQNNAPLYLKNEDPFLFFDARGNWHLLGHRYDYRDGFPVNPNQTMPLLVSGHAYSKDGVQWYFNTAQQPFDPVVKFANGTRQHFSTFERPHLVFGGANGRTPTHLVSAVQAYYTSPETGEICDGCESRPGSDSSCVVCKTTSGIDYTFTLVLPLITEYQAPGTGLRMP